MSEEIHIIVLFKEMELLEATENDFKASTSWCQHAQRASMKIGLSHLIAETDYDSSPIDLVATF